MQTTQIMTMIMTAILMTSGASVVVADEAQYLDSDYSVKDENNTEIPAMTSAGNVRERRANRQYVARKNRRIARWLNPARLLRRWLSMPTARRVALIAQHKQTQRVTGILGLAALVALAYVFPVVGLVGAVVATEADTEATEAVPAVKRLSKAEWIANKVKQGEDQMLEIIAPLFEGKLPQWAKPWEWGGTVVSMPLNADTGKRYLGANVWNLSGFTIPIFATKKQWYKVAKRIGFDFSKATGTPVLKEISQYRSRLIWTPFKQKILVDDKNNINKKTGKPKKKAIYVVKKGEHGMTIGGLAEVFNIEDTNLPVDAVAETINFTTSQPDFGDVAGTEDIDNLIMENLKGVQVTHADLDRACYASWKDVITMPFAGLFKANGVTQYESYSATALHEASHATGHRLRAARPLGNVFGSKAYAREELIAEMSSILCMRMLGLDINAPHHGKYLAGWANRVLGQPRDDENKEQWMDACRKVLGEATKASAWVMTGQPDWFEGPKTTEGEAIPQGESEMMHRALPEEEGVATATSATLEWDIHPNNVKGFTTLCKRILRAFTARDIEFSYEIGDAHLGTVMEWNRLKQKQVAVERWVVPVTVTHGPLSDSGWTALATIVPFDPSEVGKTEALVRVIPTEAPEYPAEDNPGEEYIEEWQEEMVAAQERLINHTVASRLTNGIYDPTICDHCGVRSHNRKKLVLVKHDTVGSHRIVGSSCLYEYTQIDPKSLENLFTIRENHDPYEGMDTDPYSWTQSIDKRELGVFLDILTELFAIRGGYQRGLGSEAMNTVMGYEIQPEKGQDTAYDRHRVEVEPSMAYHWVEVYGGRGKATERSGWEAESRKAGHNLDLGRAATDYIRAALVEAGGAESPRDSFQQTLGVTSRAGLVTFKTCNFVAGSASRFFKEKQKAARDEAHSDDLKAFPVIDGQFNTECSHDTGYGGCHHSASSMLATVGDKRAFEGNYGPSNVLTLIVGGRYRMKAFSNAKPVRDAAVGDTIEILSFIPTKVEEWKGQESLMVRSLKIRAVEQEQEGFNAAMLGPALLMDPTLSTLALCAIVALMGAIRVKLHPEPSKLRQVWNNEFGEDHAGQTYPLNCQSGSMKIDEKGWCHVDREDSNCRDNCGAKFPPWAYVIIEPTEEEEREYEVTRDGYMSVYDDQLNVQSGLVTTMQTPEDFMVILKEQMARLHAELNGVREVPVDFDWSAELEQEQEEPSSSPGDCCEANSWIFTADYQHRLDRASRWVDRYTSAMTQGHNEPEMERFDNYVEHEVDTTDAGMDEMHNAEGQEESMGAILGLPLLMDPTLTTLALGLVGLMVMAGWKAKCSFVGQHYRDQFNGDGPQTCAPGYATVGKRDGIPIDEWGWEDGGAFYEQQGSEIIAFSSERCKIIKTLSANQKKDFVECYKDAEGQNGDVARQWIQHREKQEELIAKRLSEPEPEPEPEQGVSEEDFKDTWTEVKEKWFTNEVGYLHRPCAICEAPPTNHRCYQLIANRESFNLLDPTIAICEECRERGAALDESRVRDSTEDRLRLLHKDDLIAIILGLEDRDEYVEDCISEHGAVMIGLGLLLDPSGLSLGAFIGVALAALISMQTQKVKSQTTESGEREMHYALAGYLSDNEDKPTPSDEQMAFINDYCYGLEVWVTGDEASQAIPPLRGPRMVCEAVAGSGKTFVLKIMLDCTRRIEASLVTRASAFNRHISLTMKDVLKALMKEGFTGADIIGTSNSVQAAGAAIMRDFYEKQGRKVKWQGPTTPIGDQRWRVLSKLAVTEAMTPEVIQSVVASGLLEKPNQRPYYNRIVTDVTKTVKALADAGYLPRFDLPSEYCEVASARLFANRIDKMKEIVERVEGPMGLNDICIHWIPDDLGWAMVDEAFKRIVETAWLTTEITVEDDCLVTRLGGYNPDLAPLSICAQEAKMSITDFKVKSGLFWPPREEEEKARNRMPAGSAALTLTRIEGLKDGLEGYNGKLLVQFGDGRAANTKMEDAEGEAIPAQQWVKDYAPGHRNGARFGNYWPDASGLMDALGLKGDWIRIIDEHDPTVETLARRFSTLRGGEGFNGPDQASGPTPQSDTMILSFADQVFLPNYFDLELHEKWDVAFIDELQDLSVSRAQLIWRCIDLDHSAIVCVGDRKQAIYFWSGASTAAFDDTITHIDATGYPMTISWRGGNHVAEAAVRICAEGLEDCKAVQPDADYPDYSVHSAPPIEGWRDGGRTITIDHSRIADAVKHIRESRFPLSDTEKPFAVLSYLTGALSGVIIQLVKAGIPITTPAGKKGIVDTVCNLLNKPFYDQLTNKKQKQGVGFNSLSDYSEYAIMSRLERVERMEFNQAVKRANGDVALADKDDYYNEVRDILEMAECLIGLWLSKTEMVEISLGRLTVAQFKKWCNEVLFKAKGDAVHLSTVHRFKGDEAGVVFMLRGVPVKNRRTGEMEVRDPFLLDHLLKQSPDTACEQMNVLYTAATRAIDQTIVVRSDDILQDIPAGAILNDSWGVVDGYSTTTIRDGSPPVVIGESGEWPDGDPDEQTATLRCGDCDDRVNPDDHGVCSDCGALLCNHRVPERGRRGGKLSNAGQRTPTAYRPQIITDKTDSGRGITSCGTYDSRAMTFDEMFSDEPKPRICVKCYEGGEA